MRNSLILVALLCSACASDGPTAPSVTPPVVVVPPVPTVPSSLTLSGTLVATNGGQALPGVSVTLVGVSSLTTGIGAFTAALPGSGTYGLVLSGGTIVPRFLNVLMTGSRALRVDAIGLNGGFDLAYYRQIVRNGYEAPSVLQPVRRWTRTPNIYLKTVDEVGEAIHGPTLTIIEAAAKDAVPRWTGGALGVPIVERGTGSREGVSGWITIKFPSTNTITEGYCGRAQVGVDGGWIELNYHNPPINGNSCRVPGAVIAAHVVEHEFGHALGFYHTGTIGDLMYTAGSWYSPTGLPSAHELAAAAIAYARPVGNLDPDSDPTSTVNLAPMSVR